MISEKGILLTLPVEFLILLTLKIQLLSLASIMFAAIGIAHQDGKIDVMLVVNTIKTPYGVLCFLFIPLHNTEEMLRSVIYLSNYYSNL